MDNSKVKVPRGSYKRDESHAGELGSWKDEGAGTKIISSYFHRAKQYAEVFEDGTEHVKSKGIPKFIIKKNGKDIFFNRTDENNAVNQFKVGKIGKDHKKHCMIMTSVTKKIWGSEEDKVERNQNGDYRPWGTEELIKRGIEQDVNQAKDWLVDYI